MNETIKDGGPAFPVFPETGAAHDAAFRGMTLRDFFAAKAIDQAAIDERAYPTGIGGEASYVGIASRAYLMADAMLRAREVQP